MKFFCVLLLLFLTGCGDRYSLDEKRGPDPEGFVTTHPLSLPPDYMLRAPEPVKSSSAAKQLSEKKADTSASTDKEPEKENTSAEKTEK